MQLWPFNRKQDQTTDIPKEVQDYYHAEKRERVGVASLLAVGTLLATIVVVMGLFFGGRWAYRALFTKDKSSETAQQQEDTDKPPEASPEETDDDGGLPDVIPEPVAPPAPNPPVASGSQSQPQSTRQSGDLPDTGPADTIRLAVTTFALASTGYYFFGDKKRTAN